MADVKTLIKDKAFTLEALFKPVLPPSHIVGLLNKYVIGQDEAKKTLATVVSSHTAIVTHNTKPENKGSQLRKNNLMLIGSSGSGKTYLVETLGKVLERDVLIIDISMYTSAGYVGRDTDSIIEDASDVCDKDPERMNNMIIFVDEIDKISSAGENGTVNSTKVQSQLLKLAESVS